MNKQYFDDSINIYDKDIEMCFYRCKKCGRILASTEEMDEPLSCCGKKMELLIPSAETTTLQKHMPLYEIDGHSLIVTVGSKPHPMKEGHHIEWICVVTGNGIQWQPLSPDSAPVASFRIRKGEKLKAIYEYCNLHGLGLYA